RCRDNRLRGRCRNRNDHVRLVANELPSDLGSGSRVTLGRLINEFQALAFLVAGLSQCILDAIANRIKRRVLNDRCYRDSYILGLRGKHQSSAGRQCKKQSFHSKSPPIVAAPRSISLSPAKEDRRTRFYPTRQGESAGRHTLAPEWFCQLA